jgi:hypothetical protein
LPESGTAFDEAWAQAMPGFIACSEQAAAAKRGGTIWVDVRFPSTGKPTWRLRASRGIAESDKRCVTAVIRKDLMPALVGSYKVVTAPAVTRQLSIGKANDRKVQRGGTWL